MIGLALTAGILASTAGESKAQFAMPVGNPYFGQGVAIGNPGFVNSGFVRPVFPGYPGVYNGFSNPAFVASPGAVVYSSGYQGFAPPVVGYPVGVRPIGFVNRPVFGGFGVRPFGFGMRGGFRPFRGVNSWLWY
jgi:hypothetical protein